MTQKNKSTILITAFFCSLDCPKQPRIGYPFYRFLFSMICGTISRGTDYRRPERKSPSLNGRKSTPTRDHLFKTSANFHDFLPLGLPPYHRHSSKMLMKGIFDPYVLCPFYHQHMGTPLPP